MLVFWIKKIPILLIVLLIDQEVLASTKDSCDWIMAITRYNSRIDPESLSLENQLESRLNDATFTTKDGRTIVFKAFRNQDFERLLINELSGVQQKSFVKTLNFKKTSIILNYQNGFVRVSESGSPFEVRLSLSGMSKAEMENYVHNSVGLLGGVQISIYEKKGSEEKFIGSALQRITQNGNYWVDASVSLRDDAQGAGVGSFLMRTYFEIAPRGAQKLMVSVNVQTNQTLNELQQKFKQKLEAENNHIKDNDYYEEKFLEYVLSLSSDQQPLWIRTLTKTGWKVFRIYERKLGYWNIDSIKQ